MIPRVLGIGTAVPPAAASQLQAARLALETTLLDPDQHALVQGLYKRAGVSTRGSALLTSTTPHHLPVDQSFFPPTLTSAPLASATPAAAAPQPWPTTRQRMAAFPQLASPMALAAARQALDHASTAPGSITHLVTVSCTGMHAPGVDVALVRELGLHPGVQRLNIGFMGCHGGIVAARTAAALAAAPAQASNPSRPPPRILAVCIELCTLHLQRTDRAEQHVANALFADGAAAIVVGPSNQSPSPPAPPAPHIRSSSSMLFDDSITAMGWTIGDHGFEMTLDRRVPEVLAAGLGPWIWPWLRQELGSAVQPDDLRWAVHPGGPRILDAIETALNLGPTALAHSRTVLSDHGNMSSATVLFILRRMLQQGTSEATADAPADRRPIVMLAFGPGLTGEAALLTVE
jgi:predicted naringenin-chalcone synthase